MDAKLKKNKEDLNKTAKKLEEVDQKITQQKE